MDEVRPPMLLADMIGCSFLPIPEGVKSNGPLRNNNGYETFWIELSRINGR
jgi:hypothetical protein